MAKSRGIEGYTKKTKNALVELLSSDFWFELEVLSNTTRQIYLSTKSLDKVKLSSMKLDKPRWTVKAQN